MRFRFMSDDDGHHYCIPNERVKEFEKWMDTGDEDDYDRFNEFRLGFPVECYSFENPIVEMGDE